MNFTLIKEFIAVVENRQISKAAEQMYTTQPLVSRHIKKMEEELGFKLITRTNPIQMTQAGLFFYNEIKKIVQEYENLCMETRLISKNVTGTLNIGITSTTKDLFIDTIRSFKTQYENVYINISIKPSEVLLDDLINDKIDVASLNTICNRTMKYTSQFVSEPIAHGKLALVVSKKDKRFKDVDAISIKEIAELQIIEIQDFYHRENIKIINETAKNYHNITLSNIVRAQNMDETLFNIQLFNQIFITPKAPKPVFGYDLKQVEIIEPEFTYSRNFYWKYNNENPNISLFAKHIKNNMFQSDSH